MPLAIDLPLDEQRALQTLLAEHVPSAEVWAYGSRVRGGAHEGSDLDLVVRFPGPLASAAALAALRNACSESLIPFLIDVQDWADLPESFRDEIRRGYVVLQGAHAVQA